MSPMPSEGLRNTILVFILCAFLQALALHASAVPVLEIVEGKLEEDLGECARNTPLAYELILKNTGDASAWLKAAKVSCGGCSPIRFDREEVAPGQKVRLTAKFKAGKYRGPQSRRLFVETNAQVPKLSEAPKKKSPGNEEDKAPSDETTAIRSEKGSNIMEVRLKWNVRAYLDCRPEKIEFGKKLYAGTLHGKLVLDVEGLTSPVKVLKTACPSPHVKLGSPQYRRAVVSKERPANPGNPFDRIFIPYSLLPTAPAGDFQAEITIQTDHKKEPLFHVPIEGFIMGPFVPKKGYINFGLVGSGKQPEKRILIDAVVGGAERIEDVEYDKELLECRIEEKGRRKLELVARPLATLAEGSYRTTVTLHTSCAVQKEIAFPVLAVIRD